MLSSAQIRSICYSNEVPNKNFEFNFKKIFFTFILMHLFNVLTMSQGQL